MGPPLGVALPGPPAGELGAVGPAVPGVVGFVLPVGAVGVVAGAGEPLGDPVEGVLGVEPESDGVEGTELGDELPGPDVVGVGDSGFCDGVVARVPLPPGFSRQGCSFEPLPRPGSLVKTSLW